MPVFFAVLHGSTIEKEHCIIRNMNGEVYLHPCSGSMCSVQGIECTEPTRLSQGLLFCYHPIISCLTAHILSVCLFVCLWPVMFTQIT